MLGLILVQSVVFLKDFVEKVDFFKKISRRQKIMKNVPVCKDGFAGNSLQLKKDYLLGPCNK